MTETLTRTQKTQRVASTAYALAYAQVLPGLREIAREHGYCLAVHGSMATDLDIVCCPWTEDATDAHTLVEAIRDAVDGIITIPAKEGEKPHGRMAWNIIPALWLDRKRSNGADIHWKPWIDISVMPRTK